MIASSCQEVQLSHRPEICVELYAMLMTELWFSLVALEHVKSLTGRIYSLLASKVPREFEPVPEAA